MNTHKLIVQSPKEIDDHLFSILNYLKLNANEAQLLEYSKPSKFVPEVAMCHFNAWLQLRYEGGNVQCGWILGQDKNAFFSEAIFHTVWKSSSGQLIDVTPRVDAEEHILFIPDYSRQITLAEHKGKPAIITFDNVRLQANIFEKSLETMKVVFESEFVHTHRLWPWTIEPRGE